jgi:acyl transferase domain-containing protein
LIPANLHFKNPNPRIPFAEWKIAVPTASTPWPYEGLRRLSVNSFGYGGANAHAILDDAYHYLAKRGLKANHCTIAPSSTGPLRALKWSERVNGHAVNGIAVVKANGTKMQKPSRLVVFSTQDQDGLGRQRQDLSKYLAKHTSGKTDTDTILRNLAFTLSEKRSRLPWKSYCITSSMGELMQSLENKDHPSVRSTLEPRLGFVFTGQGAQWAKMGIELLRYNVFRQSVEAADKYLKQELGCWWSALEEMSRDDTTSNINLPFYSQTLCTVLQVALVELLESWKISPRSVVGHSSGEIAAAYCIGSLSRENAWKIAYYRGLLSSQMKSMAPTLKGAMLAVGASETQARKWIARVTRGDTVVACINSPSSVTVSGDEAGIDELAAMLKKEGVFARKLKVETAYHSHHMNSIAIPYFEALRDIIPTEALPGRQMFTSVSGSLVDFSELGAAHWVRNLLSPVLFSDAVYELVRPKEAEDQATGAAVDMLVEIGPHSALQGPVSQILKKYGIKDVEYRSVLSRGRDGVQTSLTAAGEMFAHGVPVDIKTLNLGAETEEDHISGSPKALVDMPTYAWNHSRTYWAESRVAKHYRLREYSRLSLVGAPYPAFGESERQWRGFLRISEEPWIRDHKIQSSILYPAAGFLAMAIEAASQIADPSLVVREFRLREIQISSAVVLNEESDLECILQFRPHATGTRDNSGAWLEFSVSTCPEGEDPRRNCSGLLVIEYESAENSSMSTERALEEQACKNQYYEASTTCRTLEDKTEFYKELESIGLVYGPTFRNLSEIRSSEQGLSCCAVDVVDTGSTPVSRRPDRPHIIHPTVLDAMFHAAFAALKGRQGTLSEAMVPKFIEEVVIAADIGFQTGTRFRGYSTSAKHGFRELVSNIHMLDDSLSKQVVAIKGFNCAEVSSSMSGASDEETAMNEKKICSKLVWKPAVELLSAEQQKEVIEAVIPQHTRAETAAAIEKEEMLAFASVRHSFEKVSSREIPTMQLRNFYKWMEDQLKISSHSSHTAAGTNGGEMGATLEKVLRGKADAKQLLKEQSLDQFYAHLRGMEESRTKLSEVSLCYPTTHISP